MQVDTCFFIQTIQEGNVRAMTGAHKDHLLLPLTSVASPLLEVESFPLTLMDRRTTIIIVKSILLENVQHTQQ